MPLPSAPTKPSIATALPASSTHPPLLNHWRYLRRDEAIQLVDCGVTHADRLAEAIANDATVWRFPWPDEDEDAARCDLDAILSRQVDRCLALILPPMLIEAFRKMTHEETTPRLATQRGGHTRYWRDVCGESMTSRSDGMPTAAEIVGRRWTDGRAFNVLRCPRCGATMNAPLQSSAALAAKIRGMAPKGWVGRWFHLTAGRVAENETVPFALPAVATA